MSSNASTLNSSEVSVNDTGISFVSPGEVLSAAIVLPLLGILLISLRFWVRKTNGTGLKADDWTILAALPFTVGMAIMMIWGVAERSLAYPSPPYPVQLDSIEEMKLTERTREQDVVFIVYWVTWLLMILANGMIKISALILYRRVFVVRKFSAIDIITQAMFVICVLWTVGFFFAQVFGCGTDFSKPFGNLMQVASCHTNMRLDALMISDLVTDCMVWIIPFPVVWTLNMSLYNKLAVTGVLLLATISLVAAGIRLRVELGISSGGYSINIDDNQVLTVNIYWSNIESGLALIAACLPTLKLPMLAQGLSSAVLSVRHLLSTQRSRNTNQMTVGSTGSSADISTTQVTAKTDACDLKGREQYELSRLSEVDVEAQAKQNY